MKSGHACTVALAGFNVEDELSLRSILDCGECSSAPKCKWQVHRTAGVEATLSVLRRRRIPIVLCDRDLQPSVWKELLHSFKRLPKPPLLIVTSRVADESLWAEALNLGSYDVLAKPFHHVEVIRTVHTACLSWDDRQAPASAAAASW